MRTFSCITFIQIGPNDWVRLLQQPPPSGPIMYTFVVLPFYHCRWRFFFFLFQDWPVKKKIILVGTLLDAILYNLLFILSVPLFCLTLARCRFTTGLFYIRQEKRSSVRQSARPSNDLFSSLFLSLSTNYLSFSFSPPLRPSRPERSQPAARSSSVSQFDVSLRHTGNRVGRRAEQRRSKKTHWRSFGGGSARIKPSRTQPLLCLWVGNLFYVVYFFAPFHRELISRPLGGTNKFILVQNPPF
jgi:hypothetical protein